MDGENGLPIPPVRVTVKEEGPNPATTLLLQMEGRSVRGMAERLSLVQGGCVQVMSFDKYW